MPDVQPVHKSALDRLNPSVADRAVALLNTKNPPSGLPAIRDRSREARAYHRLQPYPQFAFKTWKTEDLGAVPVCYPFVRSILEKGSKWLFGNPFQIQCAGNEALETFLREAWEANRMPSRLVAMAEDGAQDGGVALKFAYDPARKPHPLSIQTLSIVDEVRFYYHPHDRDELLMARVQYPYWDAREGCTYWYREEWTADLYVQYLPVKSDRLKPNEDLDKYESWTEAFRTPNPFGLIPIQHVRNIETDDVWGFGDLWDLYRVADQVNKQMYLWDRKNQHDAGVNAFLIDLERMDDADRPIKPNEAVMLESREEKPGSVVFPPSQNATQEAIHLKIKEVLRQLYQAASSVDLDESEVTNKGNLTQAVMEQIYAPLIEITHEKRKSYGQDGIAPFLQRVATGLSRAGVSLGVREADAKSYTIELKWPAFFELTEEERQQKTARLNEQEVSGYVPHEIAVQEISQMEGRDQQAVTDLLEKEDAHRETVLKQAVATGKLVEAPPAVPGLDD